MLIEAVIVCSHYSDFLSYTLPENLQHLDRIVVVTHLDDKATQALCNKYGVDCIETEVFNDEGDKFNKGRGVNLGLSHLRHEGWLLHLDADILLPHRFRSMLRYAKLEEKNIYGADRLNTLSFDHWKGHQSKTVPQHQWRCLVTPTAEFPLGARLLHQEYGWCPIGYFQLHHSSQKKRYPVISGSAEHSDVLFATQWSRRNRILLPEFFVYHLESGSGDMGVNWAGRVSPQFGDRSIIIPPKLDQPRKQDYSK